MILVEASGLVVDQQLLAHSLTIMFALKSSRILTVKVEAAAKIKVGEDSRFI